MIHRPTEAMPLFGIGAKPAPPAPIDPNVLATDVPRLTGQCLAILDRLRKGPATNVELAALSLKYTSRISDLRAAGHTIKCKRLPEGLTTYTLVN